MVALCRSSGSSRLMPSALGAKKLKSPLRSSVFPMLNLEVADNMAECLLALETTKLAIVHVPSRRSQQWEDFIHRVWDCCLRRPCRCLLVLLPRDQLGASILSSSWSLTLSVSDCISAAGPSSYRPPFRRRLIGCHFGVDFPVFCRVPVDSVWSAWLPS